MPTKLAGRRSPMDHPARFVVLWFLVAIGVGTTLLLLPAATTGSASTDLVEAAFTATSAVCVTGLAVVDTSTHWSGFGLAVILGLVELGGLGFMTIASLIVMMVSRRLGLRRRLATNAERSSLSLGDVRGVLRGLALVTFTVQTVVAVILALRLSIGGGLGLGQALWQGGFHSVMAFNNAGFSLYPDSFNRFSGDPLFLAPVMIAVVIGGVGFPVIVDITRIRGRWKPLTLHSKVTLVTTAALLLIGFVVLTACEWSNPATLGPMPTPEKLLNGSFASVTPRTAGFSTVDVASMRPESLLATLALMFVGAGSAGTSGGIKVSTFAILAMVIWCELRGDREVTGFRRRIPDTTLRQAITVSALAMTLVLVATTVLLVTTPTTLGSAAFEAVSAFGTVGLSTGLTPRLASVGQVVLIVVMLVGRVGPITLGAALILRDRPTRFRFPEEGPLIG